MVVCLHICPPACGGQNSAEGVSPQSLFLEIGSLVVASRVDWLANKSQGSACPQILGTGIAMMYQVLSGGSRVGIHIFMLHGTSLTEPFS